MSVTENTLHIQDNAGAFKVTILEARQPTCIVFFAAGRGGSPLRHLSLLRAIAVRGFTIIAPHFDMLASSVPTIEDLNTRIRRLELASKQYARFDEPVIGIGHSLGCVLLLALAGGKAKTLSGCQVVSGPKWQFKGLALLAPPVDFFRHPYALQSVDARIHLRVGGKDTVTPPTQALTLMEILPKEMEIEVKLDEDAGHFSYMDELPPHIKDVQPDKQKFLSALAIDIAQFITSSC
ncbi:alpha/beta hydrolase [Mucilaginibacter litoreus]|uniref:Alpha/beta hydrolase n=1 Tax=Mucilaginibacter litoreus TaxID=1048221 RepID=A0ABW3AQU8_9SPHI